MALIICEILMFTLCLVAPMFLIIKGYREYKDVFNKATLRLLENIFFIGGAIGALIVAVGINLFCLIHDIFN